MSKANPTIRDVARQAGVSHQTVSRVINSSDDVTPETRERVEAAIAELDYHPNAIARSMARGRTRTLACISPNLTDYTFASIIEGAEAEARRLGYFLLSSSARDSESFEALINELVGHRRVDGLLVMNPYADERYQLIPENIPVVFVGARSRGDSICSVCLDDEAVAYDATSYLVACGHTRIGMVTGPMAEDCSMDRIVGFQKALEEHGLSFLPELIIEGNWSASSGQAALMQLSANSDLPDALFVQNDRMAMGVLRAARDLKIAVPGQLSIIGVDDMPLTQHYDPPLTTMRQDMPLIGLEAARILIHSIEGGREQQCQLKLPAELVVRQSVKRI
ncbi:MAG: LacI family DNA-binding transcriptional regulator [Anaerolineales bacterium]